MAMMRTGGDILLDCLEKYGVEYIFCSPGTEWAPVWEGLAKRQAEGNTRLKYINCRHENLAVSLAQGYYEATGKLAAVLLHSGVGTLNGALAIRTAYFAKAAILIMSGETYEHGGDGQGRPQGFHWLAMLSDIGGPSLLVKDYVKWSNPVHSKDGLVDAINRGIQIARSPVPGPSFITVAPELLAREYPLELLRSPFPSSINIELPIEGLGEAAKWLIESRRPIILTERAGLYPGAVTALVSLAESLAIPVFDFFAFAGNFPKDHPLYQGYDSLQALAEADVVLVVGSNHPWYPPSICVRENLKIILLDDDSLHENIPHWGYRIDLSLTTDIEKGLVALSDILKSKLSAGGGRRADSSEQFSFWKTRHDKMLLEWRSASEAEAHTLPISARWFLHRAHELLPADSLIVDETIMHTRMVHQYLAGESNYFRPTYGGLGVGFGEALGVKIARPQKPVVLVIGDGTFNYNPVLAGFGLCQEYGLPILVILINNGGYLAMKRGHTGLYPKGAAVTNRTFFGVDITPTPDYGKIAEAFGAYSEKVENNEQIGPAFERALKELAGGRTALLDVVMN